MGARAESLAKQFESQAAEMTKALGKLTDADWKKVTASEKWSVGVTAHHVASSHEPIAGIVKTLGAGGSIPGFTMEMLNDGNAKHAREFANCTKAETLALHEKGVAAAAAVVRTLSDADLERSGTVITGAPALTTQQAIEGIMINHINEHLASIQKTVAS